jgi:hypothetical protein
MADERWDKFFRAGLEATFCGAEAETDPNSGRSP